MSTGRLENLEELLTIFLKLTQHFLCISQPCTFPQILQIEAKEPFLESKHTTARGATELNNPSRYTLKVRTRNVLPCAVGGYRL